MPSDKPDEAKPDEAQADGLERAIKIFAQIVAVATLVLGTVKFLSTQSVEAAKPYLEKKLEWCAEATETAAIIATHERNSQPKSEERFWELYWGVMGMIEKRSVTQAMIDFGNGIQGTHRPEIRQLPALALAVAHACRDEMARDWSPKWARD